MSAETICPLFSRTLTLLFSPTEAKVFCYAAHELFQLGIPLIVNDIPGFRGSFPDGSVRIFDGTPHSLATSIADLLDRDAEVRRLRSRPAGMDSYYAGTPYSQIIAAAKPAEIGPEGIHLRRDHHRSRSSGVYDLVPDQVNDVKFIPVQLEETEERNSELMLYGLRYRLYKARGLTNVFELLSEPWVVVVADPIHIDWATLTNVVKSAPRGAVYTCCSKTINDGDWTSVVVPDLHEFAGIRYGQADFVMFGCKDDASVADIEKVLGRSYRNRPFLA